MPPVHPYNPLDKGSIGDNVVRELTAQPCISLPAAKSRGGKRSADQNAFEGAGIYAIYYFGDFAAYAQVAAANAEGTCQTPIYVGKADPAGGRKGALQLDSSTGYALYNRLRDHATSIIQVANLRLEDFRCRYLVVDDVWISLGERRAIRTYLPLWNTLIDGFGNHDPGNRRKDQYRSDWDVVHPGHQWAEKLGQSPKTVEQILAAALNPPPAEQLEIMAEQTLKNEDEQ